MKKQVSTPVAELPSEEKQQEQQPETSAEAAKSGADAMRVAVDAALKQNSIEIAQALVDSCLGGHMMAGRLLYMIAVDKVKLTAEEIKQTRSLALKWAEEDEWTPEASERIAETTAGSLEPE